MAERSQPRGRFWRGLDWMWLGPEDGTTLGLLRIGVVAVLLASLLCHAGAFAEYFSSRSPLHGTWARDAFPSRMSIFFAIEQPWAVQLVFAVGIAAHVAWMVGWYTPVAAVLSWALWLSMSGRNPLLYSLPDQLQMVLCTLLMLMPSGRAFSLDARRMGRRQVPVWCRRVWIVQIATLYTATGLLKSGDTWHRDGTALYYALVNPYNRHFDIGPFYASLQPWLLRPMTHVVLWWEILFAVFVAVHVLRSLLPRRWWFPDLRWPMLGFGVAMHVGIQLALYVVWFSPLMIVSYLAFVSPAELAAVQAWWRRRRPATTAAA